MMKRYTASVRLQIPCDTRYVAMARKSIRCIAESNGFGVEECQDIELAVAEAVSNAIVHGRPASGSPVVFVKCVATLDEMIIEVEDEGRIECVPASHCLPPDSQENGRGTIIMREVMDEMVAKCTSRGLIVRMRKKRRPCRKDTSRPLPLVSAVP